MFLDILRSLVFFALHVDNSAVFPKPLSKSEELELFGKASVGDEQARKKLIEHNLRLVAHIVKKYASNLAIASKLECNLFLLSSVAA